MMVGLSKFSLLILIVEVESCLRKVSGVRLLYLSLITNVHWLTSVLSDPLKWMPMIDDNYLLGRPLDLVANPDETLRHRLKNMDFVVGTTKSEVGLFVGLSEAFGRLKGGTFFLFRGKQSWLAYLIRYLLSLHDKSTETTTRIAAQLGYTRLHFHQRTFINLVNRMFQNDEPVIRRVLKVYSPTPSLDRNIVLLVDLMTAYLFTCSSRKVRNGVEGCWCRPLIDL